MKRHILICLLLFPICLTAQDREDKVKRMYYHDDSIALETFFDENGVIDRMKSYYKTGELSQVIEYDGGKYNGASYQFNEEGDKLTTWNFEDGVLINRIDHIIDFNKKNEEQVKKLHLQLEKINEVIKLNPNNFGAVYYRGNLRQRLGNSILALDDFLLIEKKLSRFLLRKKIPKLHELMTKVYDNLGRAYNHFEQETKALHYYHKAALNDPEDMRIRYNLGAYLYKIKSYRLAIVSFDRVLKKWEKHPFTHRALGALYTDFEDYEKALNHVNIAFLNEEQLIRLGDKNVEHDIRTIRGLIYHKLGKSKEGIKDLKQAIELNPKNSFAHRNLGVIYYDLGKHTLACELLQKADELGYERKNNRDDLKKYQDVACLNQVKQTDDLKMASHPYIYPNPVKNIINIENFDFTNFNFELYNFNAVLVKQGISQEKTISIEDILPGVYVLKILIGDKNYEFRLIKE